MNTDSGITEFPATHPAYSPMDVLVAAVDAAQDKHCAPSREVENEEIVPLRNDTSLLDDSEDETESERIAGDSPSRAVDPSTAAPQSSNDEMTDDPPSPQATLHSHQIAVAVRGRMPSISASNRRPSHSGPQTSQPTAHPWEKFVRSGTHLQTLLSDALSEVQSTFALRKQSIGSSKRERESTTEEDDELESSVPRQRVTVVADFSADLAREKTALVMQLQRVSIPSLSLRIVVLRCTYSQFVLVFVPSNSKMLRHRPTL
jgi:hypothetical protein